MKTVRLKRLTHSALKPNFLNKRINGMTIIMLSCYADIIIVMYDIRLQIKLFCKSLKLFYLKISILEKRSPLKNVNYYYF